MRDPILRGAVSAVICTIAFCCSPAVDSNAIQHILPGRYELVNGNWFNGQSFERRTMWIADGRFSAHKVSGSALVDLHDGYVIPPFAEAHTHNIGCPPTDAEAMSYVRAGIQYAMVQSATYPPRQRVSASAPVDVVCAGAVLTPSGSHIVVLDQRSADRGNFPGLTRNDLDGRTHVIVDSLTDVERKLPPILATKPRYIKLIMGFSEEYDRRRTDDQYVGRRGLDPRLVPTIVELAHKAGVRVSVHIETAEDFRVAVRAGVDMIAHLPGYRIGSAAGFSDTSTERWRLTTDDARAAAARGIPVITTLAAARALRSSATEATPEGQAIAAIHGANIALLREHGVPVIVGSDFYGGTVMTELFLLSGAMPGGLSVTPLHLLKNGELLRMATTETPRYIFPERKIGRLQDGYEANLLVLAGNPMDDFAQVQHISLAMKNGRLLSVTAGH